VGLFNTYIGLRLSADSVSEVWIGSLFSAYYVGLVLGGRIAHRLIIRVGHIRAYVAAASLSAIMVLAQTLTDVLGIWLMFRLIAGVCLVTQYVVIESWLNEQIDNTKRGRVFAVYLVMSGLGTALGQLAITLYPTLDARPLTFVAMCQAAAMIPIALTMRTHPAAQLPAPLDLRFFFTQAPMVMVTMFLAGNISATFYGLAPVFAAKFGMSTAEVAVFVSTAVIAGLLAQWPMGWLSDHLSRVKLIKTNALILMALAILMTGWLDLPWWLMLSISAAMGVLQFTFYALASSLAYDNVSADRRMGMSAVLLMVYGVGASLGPMIAGTLMKLGGPSMFYVFTTICALVLFLVMGAQRPTPRRMG
jgi:MFS family permease